MKKKKFLVIKIIAAVIISVILGLSVYTWNAQTLMGNSLPMPLGFGVAEVLTDSMTDLDHPETSIYRGDVIIVVPQDEYYVGDVIAFQSQSVVVTHRIIDINEDGEIFTKGDSPENTPDGIPLKKTDIFGKVVKVLPDMGNFVSFIKTPIVTVSILLLAIILFLFSNKKEKENEPEDDEIAKLKAEIEKIKNPDSARSTEDIKAEIEELKKQINDNDKNKS